jgi:hypothetical protein
MMIWATVRLVNNNKLNHPSLERERVYSHLQHYITVLFKQIITESAAIKLYENSMSQCVLLLIASHMPPSGLSVVALEYFIGMRVLGEGAMVKCLTKLAIAIFTSINTNLIPVSQKIRT